MKKQTELIILLDCNMMEKNGNKLKKNLMKINLKKMLSKIYFILQIPQNLIKIYKDKKDNYIKI